MDINGAIAQLSASLTGTTDFNNLRNARKNVLRNLADKNRLEAFERNQNRLNDPNLSPQDADRLLRGLQDEYRELNTIPAISAYFAAVEIFNGVFSSVINNLQTSVDKQLQ